MSVINSSGRINEDLLTALSAAQTDSTANQNHTICSANLQLMPLTISSTEKYRQE